MRFAALFLVCLIACGNDPSDGSKSPSYVFDLPVGFPQPLVPEDNPMSDAKVELGRYLFYDPRLSGNQTQSCASCHEQGKAFADGKVTPSGSTGTVLARNAMSLTNVAYNTTFTWWNPLLGHLEDQAMVPMFGDNPVELGMSNREDEILARFSGDATYQDLFRAAFPSESHPFTVANLVKAIASFERVLISGTSAYDRYMYYHDKSALSDSAQRGRDLFFSEVAECYHCHGGLNFSVAFQSATSGPSDSDFFNTGLYNVDEAGAYPDNNQGLKQATGKTADMGKFRAPTLRNIALTAPYMHDGSIATLTDVLTHYNQGGRAGEGNPYKNSLVKPLFLSDQEKADLVAFLESLTDEEFVTDPRFASPFVE